MESLGQRVKRTMESQRPPLRGYQLAAMLELQQSYISKLINDQTKDTPSPDVLRGLERVLGIPVAWSLAALGYALEDSSAATDDHLIRPDNYEADIVAIVRQLPPDKADILLQDAEFLLRETTKFGPEVPIAKRQLG